MLVSTRGRYALRIMLELASRKAEERVSLAEISEKQEISLKYAEAIVALLVKSGLLDGQRGKSGGYRLVRPAKDIKVGDILNLTEESLAPVNCKECAGTAQCNKADHCKTLPMWNHLNKMISDYLFSISLEDLDLGRI